MRCFFTATAYALLSVLLMAGCRKRDTSDTHISGRVYDIRTDAPLGGALIKLEYFPGSGGGMGLNLRYRDIGSAVTDASGAYGFSFDGRSDGTDDSYRFTGQMDGYFGFGAELDPATRDGQSSTLDFGLHKKITVRIRVLHSSSGAPEDRIFLFAERIALPYSSVENLTTNGSIGEKVYELDVTPDEPTRFYWNIRRNGVDSPKQEELVIFRQPGEEKIFTF